MNIFDVNLYDYDLPADLIAGELCVPRDESRLMKVDCKKRSYSIEDNFRSILHLIGNDCVVVLNNTKVYRARAKLVKKSTGAAVEMLFLVNREGCLWEAMCKKASKVNVGDVFIFEDDKSIEVDVKEVIDEKNRVVDVGMKSEDFLGILSKIGQVPIPPYIKIRHDRDYDQEYQTVYASQIGSVAAPTAGFHFSPDLIDSLKENGVVFEEVTLHVGLGTFLPVTADDIREHKMHFERIVVDDEQLGRLNDYKKNGKKILAVGTTSVRFLESLADDTGKLNNDNDYQTNLFIYPGYKFKIVDRMITNFHLPKSTLLMLVSAFIYDKGGYKNEARAVKWLKEIYQKAINDKMRFYSFGDAMYIY